MLPSATHMIRALLFTLSLFYLPALLSAQPLLERRVDLSLHDVSQQQALEVLAQRAGFQWSYNVNLLDAGKRISYVAQGVTVREALYRILGPGFEYKAGPGYLSLKRAKKGQERLSGYLTDSRTGKRVAGATVYDRRTLRTTTTDSSGFYELPVGARAEVVIAKLDFRDTLLRINSETPRTLDMALRVNALPPARSEGDERLLDSDLGRFFVHSVQRLSTRNVRDSLQRVGQISLLPKLGTNRGMSGHVVNDFSLNLLVGYSLGNRRVEVAGLGNITRRHMQGVQVAGVFNDLRGSSRGIQVAGVWNRVGDTLRGIQVAGAFNFARRTPGLAVQLASVSNYVAKGQVPIQVAGVSNFADTLRGLQVGGLWSRAAVLRAVQVNGLWGHARRSRAGVQVAGAYNSAQQGRVNMQVAGLSNWADTLAGVQIAGLSNGVRVLRGVQLGLINHANVVDGGLQLGLLNTSDRGGYRAWELSANDVTWANLSFKSGVSAFYTHFTGGIRPDTARQALWALGFGVGSRVRLARWLGLSADVTQRHLSVGALDQRIQAWTQASLCLDLPLGRHVSLAFGPSLNLLLADPARTETAELRQRVLSPRFQQQLGSAQEGWQNTWAGGTAAVRVRW
ncbi:MAG TPA: hypothetical protein PK971_06905 [Saprospiraceae bacterium]|nr:hypothetical protein [Saprospiraceae bacterium]